MVTEQANDVFQFSTYAALNAGYNEGRPRTADLTSHGSDGIGVYEDGSLMILKDRHSYVLKKDCSADLAPLDARLPYAMVTVFRPDFRAKVPSISMDGLEEFVASDEYGPVKGLNTMMPFKITGEFDEVELEGGSKQKIAGTLFGFIVPTWMKPICGPRIHAHFLDANESTGGRVTNFQMAEEATLSFAKCGRFHMRFPDGDSWEDMKL